MTNAIAEAVNELAGRKAVRLKKFLEQREIARSSWYLWESQGRTPATWKLGRHRMIWSDVAESWLADLAAGAQ